MSEKVLFRKVFVDNLKYYFEDKKVEGYVYLTSDQEMPKADEYIEDYLHILKADGVLTNSDKTYYLLVDRSEYESDDLAELEKHLFDWAEGEYHNGNYEIVDVEDAKDSTMNKVKTEFPNFDDLESFEKILNALKGEGFEDYSWHNDAMPCIGKDIGNDFHLIIWVDYKNPDLAEFVDERKDGSMKQFMFGERDADGEYTEEYLYDDADKLIADAKKILTA